MKHLPAAFILLTAACSLPAAAYNSISVPGAPDMFGANWDTSVNLLSTHSGSEWRGTITPLASSGEFKFAADNSWAVNWGGGFSILRLPAIGVGPLVKNGGNLSWQNAAANAAHTFVFHEDTETFDIVPAAAPPRTFSSVQLVGNFNGHGATTNGFLSRSGSLWTGEITVSSGSDSFQLRIDGSELWGPPASVASALPVSNLSLCGSAALSVSGIKSGTLAVSFNATNLLLSVSQASVSPFTNQYIAADGTFAAGSPTDVNLEKVDDVWTASFAVTNTSPFNLSFSQRDAGGGDGASRGGLFWGATNSTTNSYPIDENLVAVTNPADLVPLKCPGGAGRYVVSFDSSSGHVSVRRLYYQAANINVIPDPSLENCDQEGRPLNGSVSVFNARIVDAVINGVKYYGAHSGRRAAFFPPAGGGQDDPSQTYGSISRDVPVSSFVGASLSVSAWYRAVDSWTPSSTQIQIEWRNASGTAIGEYRLDIRDADPVAWKSVSTEDDKTVIPENAAVAHVVFLYSGAPASGGLLLDDLEIRIASSRFLNFDSWTYLSNSVPRSYNPDWGVNLGRTVDNRSDLILPPGSLLISKYIEGTGNNKAVEIFNGTDAPVDLSQCSLAQYDNGATAPTTVIPLSGTLAPGACFVVARPAFPNAPDYAPDPALLAAAASSGMTNKLLTFNGDDVIVLRRGSTVLDRVGQVSAAATNAFWAFVCKNRTLVRKSTVHIGLTNSVTSPFSFADWEIRPCDDFSDLGSHSRSLDDDTFLPSGLSLVFSDNAALTSPLLDGGIGDISFWYRAATSNNAGPVTLCVEAASDIDFADCETLATLSIPPSLVSFTNFSLFLNRSDLVFFRLREVTSTPGANARVDDVSVTAAIPASRYQDFNAWDNPDWAARDGNYSLASWTLADARISPNGVSGTRAALLKPDSSLTSPVFSSGIGTVVFLAAAATSSAPAKIILQVSSDSGATWTSLSTNSLSSTAWSTYSVPADLPSGAAVRFLSSGDNPLLLDNIELRPYEGTARVQTFNSWTKDDHYAERSGQGWLVSSGAVHSASSGNCVCIKNSGVTIRSPVFTGGLGTVSLDAKSYSSSHNPSFCVEISRDAGASWTDLFTVNLTTSDLDFRNFSQLVDDPAVNRVQIRLLNSKSLHVDNISCGVIKPPPSVTISPAVSPDPPSLDDNFFFTASVQTVGDASLSSVSVKWQSAVGLKPSAWTTNAMSYVPDADSWQSPSLSPFAEGTRVHYQVFATWTAPNVAGVQTNWSPILTNLFSSVAAGGVWINEIFYQYHPDDRTGGGCPPDDPFCDADGGFTAFGETLAIDQQNHEYVEICGPEGMDIGRWSLRFEFARQQNIGENGNVPLYARVTLPKEAKLTRNPANGYGFYLVGDSNATWSVDSPLANCVPTNVNADAEAMRDHIFEEGIIRLCNAYGSQVDAIIYGRQSGSIVPAGTQPDSGLSSLSLAGSNGYHAASFDWTSDASPTPGTANPAQSFSNAPVSSNSLPDAARHVPSELVTPKSGIADPFYMLNPLDPAIPDQIKFAMAFPTNYGTPSGTLHVSSSVSGSYTLPLSLYGGAQNDKNEFFLHVDVPEYTFSRFETLSYYFAFKPSASGWTEGFLASDGNGGSTVFSNETAAAASPFTYTFPFHDEFVFTALAKASAGSLWNMTLVDENEYTEIPVWTDLRLEVNTNSLLDTNAWKRWAFDPDGDPTSDGTKTTYRLKLALPEAPFFVFRLAPEQQSLPQP